MAANTRKIIPFEKEKASQQILDKSSKVVKISSEQRLLIYLYLFELSTEGIGQ